MNSYTIHNVVLRDAVIGTLHVTYPQGCDGWLASPVEARRMLGFHTLRMFMAACSRCPEIPVVIDDVSTLKELARA